jgi:site-specific DNA recombinase
MTKQAVALIRVSTTSQAETGFGIPAQQKTIREYAAKNGLTIAKELVEDISGDIKFEHRPIQSQLLKMLEQKKYGAVVWARPDRIARKNYIIGEMAERVIESGLELHIAELGQVTDPNDVRLTIEGWNAQRVKQEILKKMADGREQKIDAGLYVGSGIPPFGYQKIGRKKSTQLVIVESEAEVVRQIFDLYTSGETVLDIARQISAQGIVSSKGNTNWSMSMIYTIIKNEAYIGKFYYSKFKHDKNKKRQRLKKDEWKFVPVPRIISDAVWEQAEERLDKGKGANKRKYDYLMSKRLKCWCGISWSGVFHVSTVKGKRYETFYYICNSNHSPDMQGRRCRTPRVKMELLDSKVEEFLDELVTSGTFIAELREEQKSLETKNKPILASIERLEKQLEKKRKELKKLLTVYLATDEDDEDETALAVYKETETRIKQTISDLETEIAKQRKELEENTITDEDIDSFERELDELPKLLQSSTTREEYTGHLDTAIDAINAKLRETYRGYLERLKMTGLITVENGKRVLYLTFILGEARIEIDNGKSARSVSSNTNIRPGPQPPQSHRPLRILDRDWLGGRAAHRLQLLRPDQPRHGHRPLPVSRHRRLRQHLGRQRPAARRERRCPRRGPIPARPVR